MDKYTLLTSDFPCGKLILDMTTITIPKKITKGEDLVVIPLKRYEELLHIVEKKGYTGLDRDLDEAIVEYKAGKTFGPFSSVKALKKSLETF